MFDDMAGGTATVIRDGFWFENFGSLSPALVDSGVRSEVARAWTTTVITYANS